MSATQHVCLSTTSVQLCWCVRTYRSQIVRARWRRRVAAVPVSWEPYSKRRTSPTNSWCRYECTLFMKQPRMVISKLFRSVLRSIIAIPIPIPQNLYGALYKQNSAKGAWAYSIAYSAVTLACEFSSWISLYELPVIIITFANEVAEVMTDVISLSVCLCVCLYVCVCARVCHHSAGYLKRLLTNLNQIL